MGLSCGREHPNCTVVLLQKKSDSSGPIRNDREDKLDERGTWVSGGAVHGLSKQSAGT